LRVIDDAIYFISFKNWSKILRRFSGSSMKVLTPGDSGTGEGTVSIPFETVTFRFPKSIKHPIRHTIVSNRNLFLFFLFINFMPPDFFILSGLLKLSFSGKFVLVFI